VDASTVRDGEPLLGHADGEAVLLVRRGDEFLAIGATCTHYGGPLAEGLIDGDEVRCPWHHACFSLRTGEALRAPALSPVACWTVERRDEKIRITGKRERDPLSPTYPVTLDRSAAPRAVVIVGAGAAGSAAAEMLRRSGYGGRLAIVDDDDGSPYDRPNLSQVYLAGNAPEEWIPFVATTSTPSTGSTSSATAPRRSTRRARSSRWTVASRSTSTRSHFSAWPT
jgi:nitrite reductase/ring-hydroxylating ferredoxin subunit